MNSPTASVAADAPAQAAHAAASAPAAAAPAATPTPATEPRSDYEDSCRRHSEADARAIRDILTRIGDKWSLLVIATLEQATLRFTELQRHIPGISQRMLTLTLRQLERDGLISREVYAEVPPRVEYALTATGRTLISHATGLARWAIDNHPQIEQARERYDLQHPARVS